jgi:NTP pyrophosphatase (non-canonical NTP hydrolase)
VSIDLLHLRDKIAEAGSRYAASLNIEPTDDWLVLKTSEEAGELVQAFLCFTARAHSRGLPPPELKRALDDEIADLLGFALVLAESCSLRAVTQAVGACVGQSELTRPCPFGIGRFA